MKSKTRSKNSKNKATTMSKKLEKLREVNKSLAKRCNDLEAYMFIENIIDVPVIEPKEVDSELLAGTK